MVAMRFPGSTPRAETAGHETAGWSCLSGLKWDPPVMWVSPATCDAGHNPPRPHAPTTGKGQKPHPAVPRAVPAIRQAETSPLKSGRLALSRRLFPEQRSSVGDS